MSVLVDKTLAGALAPSGGLFGRALALALRSASDARRADDAAALRLDGLATSLLAKQRRNLAGSFWREAAAERSAIGGFFLSCHFDTFFWL